jgi:hypothetical protein
LGTVKTVQSFKLRNLSTLSDSVSLVCSSNGDFCGDKEFVLEYNSRIIPFTSLPEGWAYSEVSGVLTIDPLSVTEFRSFTLVARLKEFPNLSTAETTTRTIFNLIEQPACEIEQIIAEQPYLKFFYALGSGP